MVLKILALITIVWAIFGSPRTTIAGWIWPETAALWEKVDAYYYPDRNNLSVHRASYNVGGMDQCRQWVFSEAARLGDTGLKRGDYECGVGEIERIGDLTVYRITAK